MRDQFRYAIEDMHKHWVRMIFIVIQLTVSMYLLCVMLHTIHEAKTFHRIMNYLVEKNSIYTLNDNTEEFRFMQMYNEDDFMERMSELNDYIDNQLKIPRYIADPSYDLPLNIDMSVPDSAIRRSDKKVDVVYSLKVSTNFFTTFEIKGDFNILELEKEYQQYIESDKEIPVILGNNYKGFFNKGDVFCDAVNRKYVVHGFLKSNQYYIAPNRINCLVDLSDYVIIPCYTTDQKSEVASIFEFLSSYYTTKNTQGMYQIIEKAKELDLMSLNLLTFDEQCNNIEHDYTEKVLFYCGILCLVFTYAIIGFVGNMIQTIADSIREYSIHLLCGATEKEIICRVLFPIILMIFCADLLTLLMYGYGYEFVISIICSVLVGGCLMIYPITRIQHQSIIMLVRRNVE